MSWDLTADQEALRARARDLAQQAVCSRRPTPLNFYTLAPPPSWGNY